MKGATDVYIYYVLAHLLGLTVAVLLGLLTLAAFLVHNLKRELRAASHFGGGISEDAQWARVARIFRWPA